MVNEIIKKRRSIRLYKEDGVVSKQQIKELLEAAMLAPSACGLRPWSFIVVRNKDVIAKIAQFHKYSKMLTTAGLAIIVCLNPDIQNGYPGEGMWQHDGGAATQNILLQATDMGLGSCWCGLHPVPKYIIEIRKLFNLDKNIIPFSLVVVGQPSETFGSRDFYQEEKVTWIE